MNISKLNPGNWLLTAAVTALASMTFSAIPVTALGGGAPDVVISSIPLNVVVPSHPEVMIALSNSNSMDSSDNITDDGTPAPGATTHAPTSAIMTWSGNVGAGTLQNSTSPVHYTLPGSYTAPVTGATSGSTPYTAAINTYTRSGTTAGSWNCAASDTDGDSIPNPGGDPPTYNWPTGVLTWDDTQTWYFNDINSGGNNGYYQQASPPPYGSNYRIPSFRDILDGNGTRIAANNEGGLFSVGMGNGGGKPIPQVGGGGTTCTSGCVTPPVYDCDLYEWVPQHNWSYGVTPYGDNSASRLNIAKQSIYQVVQSYGTQVDFGLMTYAVSGINGYYSWAYYMSPTPGGFTSSDFSNTYSAPSSAGEWVVNPCWNAGGGINSDCSALASQTGLSAGNSAGDLGSYQYMLVASRSDDPDVNDVLLSNWNGAYVFMSNGILTGPLLASPNNTLPMTSPYYSGSNPIGYTLANYNSGESANCNPSLGLVQVCVQYSGTVPNIGYTGAYNLTPTNSGYVPYSPQVMFSLRGVLWAGTPNPGGGNVRVAVNAAAGTDSTSQANYLAEFAPFLMPENNVPGDDSATIPSGFVDVPPVTPAPTFSQYFNKAIYASAVQAPIAGMLSTAEASGNWPTATGTSGCTPPRYVILMTDGLPTEDLSGHSWPPPGSAAATGYGATVAFNSDGSLNTSGTNNKAVIDAINTITTLNSDGIKTFVVGMGAGVDPTLNPNAAGVLTAMAIAGGTRNYYPGSNPAAVVTQLNAILNIINQLNVASVSGAVNTTALNTGTVVYQASYTGYDTPYQDWTGNLQAFPVDSNGTVSTTANWSAQCQLDEMATGSTTCSSAPSTGTGWSTNRIIATCTPTSGTCGASTGVPFEWSNINSSQQAELEPSDSLGQERLDYLRGDTSNEVHNSGSFRDRSHILGDIVDSASLYVGPSDGPYTSDPSYQAFIASAQNQNRPPMIYVGANDGMLHAFNASTGAEAFAFVPSGVFGNLINLTNPNYNNSHQFFVDGSPTAGDVKFADGSWHTVLAGGLNDGGNTIYALDVTNPSTINSESALASDVLWEVSRPRLGLTYSQPAFALTNDATISGVSTASTNANPNGFLLFFGSGYNNAASNPILFAVNPETGKIVSKDVSQAGTPLSGINLCAAVTPNPCSSSLPNGLSGVVVVNSSGALGQPADTVYAGDLQGDLWKVDISAPDPANWVVTLLFKAEDSSGNPQPITTTPVVSLNPSFPSANGTVVYFGTGEYLGTPDITNANVQSFYAVLDNGTGTPLARANLVQQTLTATNEIVNGNNVTLRTVTNNAVNWSTEYGWYMDLPISGERVVTNPRLYNGEVVFTTYVPSTADLCEGGGQAFLMVLNYSSGSSFPQPQIDINGDGLLNSGDQVGGQNPVGMSLGDVFASAPTILSANLGAIKAMKLITVSTPTSQSSGNFQSVGEAGGLPQKITWTQLQ